MFCKFPRRDLDKTEEQAKEEPRHGRPFCRIHAVTTDLFILRSHEIAVNFTRSEICRLSAWENMMFEYLKTKALLMVSVLLLLPAMAAAAPKFALDANGGRGNPYLNAKLDQNDNLLWKIIKNGDYVRILPKVNLNAALDANGGKDKPYLNANATDNENLLWKLETHDDYVVIIPKVNQKAALDANGGRENPYLNPTADAKNVNHLWLLVKEKDTEFYRIYSKIEK